LELTLTVSVIVTLNRPKALNALSSPLFSELNDALTKYDGDKDIGAIIITGSEKAFAGNSRPMSALMSELQSASI
jgi:enoyl-CoA hydratase